MTRCCCCCCCGGGGGGGGGGGFWGGGGGGVSCPSTQLASSSSSSSLLKKVRPISKGLVPGEIASSGSNSVSASALVSRSIHNSSASCAAYASAFGRRGGLSN
jgi:hypothetical protein